MAWIRHDSHGETTIKCRQALGSASPLATDAEGYAEVVDEETATTLAALDAHVQVADGPPAEFDAADFVDRTPMEDVITDIEAGDADGHLDAVEAEASRQGVREAIEARRGD